MYINFNGISTWKNYFLLRDIRVAAEHHVGLVECVLRSAIAPQMCGNFSDLEVMQSSLRVSLRRSLFRGNFILRHWG